MNVFGSSPTVSVVAQCFAHLDRSFEYDEKQEKIVEGKLVKVKTGARRQVSRHVVQAIMSGVSGADYMAIFVPVRDYVPDFLSFRAGFYRFAVESMKADDNGLVTFYFCGFEPCDPPKGSSAK